MRICAVQTRPIAGDYAANIARHIELIRLALEHHPGAVFFPELPLTGYEPRLAKALASDLNDARLAPFQRLSDAHDLPVGVGLPFASGAGVLIGMAWFTSGQAPRGYAKQQLHDDELPWFEAGKGQLLLEAGGCRMAPAICYESLQMGHADSAASLGADAYLASVAKPAGNVARAMLHYPAVARRHGMHVAMANCVGPSDDFPSVGQSAAWNARGELLARMDAESEGILVLDTTTGAAEARALAGA